MKKLFEGNKKYIIIVGVLLAGLGAFMSGTATLEQAVVQIFQGLGVSETKIEKAESK
jgi:hypothetical protein